MFRVMVASVVALICGTVEPCAVSAAVQGQPQVPVRLCDGDLRHTLSRWCMPWCDVVSAGCDRSAS